MQPQIHLIDETWIDAPVDIVSAVVADPANWRRWWPTLNLTVTRDRRLKGIQWAARSSDLASRRAVELAGTVEIWLEPHRNGVILHHYLRLDPVAEQRLSGRAAAGATRRFAWHAKQVFWQLKDELEGQPAG
ncbi:MAG: polyketide cyclase / dehydrase and lipid transport [Jatrophihabitantaceae bacterium]